MNPSIEHKDSLVVSANAGTGKTTRLIKRVVALLIEGALPNEILCLTYTRNAAGEIMERLEEEFFHMASSCDELLIKTLEARHLAPSKRTMAQARKLFMETFASSDTLRIQTIHAFCEDFLRKRGIHRSLIKPHQKDELLAEAQHLLLKNAPDKILWDHLCKNEDYMTFKQRINQLHEERYWLDPLFDNNRATLAREALFPIPSRKHLATQHKHLTAQFQHHRAQWESIANFLSDGKKHGHAQAIRKILEDKQDLITLRSLLLRKDGHVRKIPISSKAPQESQSLVQDCAQQLQDFFRQQSLYRNAQDTKIWSLFGKRLYQECSRICTQKDWITYDELLLKTLTILKKERQSYPQYPSGETATHLLIDEAQDLSILQWQIVDHLKESALGASGSFFVVGDPKQSIYHFQGADGQKFQTLCHDAAKEKALDTLNISYRSALCLMRFVDALFTKIEEQKSPSRAWLPHHTIKQEEGTIFLYDPPEKTQDHQDNASAKKHEIIAHKELVKHLVVQVETLLEKHLKPQDIMILFPSRTQMFQDVIHALKKHSIPVAEPDKYRLGEHVVIWDLLACGHISLCPGNDLMLACVLKGLFRWNEEDLLTLRPPLQENNVSLFQCLQDKAKRAQNCHDIVCFLEFLQEGASLNPVPFYQRLLQKKMGDTSVRELLLSSQKDARIMIAIFMDTLFQYQDVALRSFLASLDMEAFVIQRETPRDSVRVMTVHAAKGLEAEAVFVCDSWKRPRLRHPFLPVEHRSNVLYIADKDDNHPCVEELSTRIKGQEKEEHERLLYVALTRAKTSLYLYMPLVKTGTPWQMFRSVIKDWKKQHSYQRINDMLLLEGRAPSFGEAV